MEETWDPIDINWQKYQSILEHNPNPVLGQHSEASKCSGTKKMFLFIDMLCERLLKGYITA